MSSEATPNFRDAEAPFNDDDADIILRSADNVDFRVHKIILSKASPVFRDMFTLPQPSSTADDDRDATRDGLSVIRMAESKHALDVLLRFCYPTHIPFIKSFDDIKMTLHLARKFDVDFVREIARARLLAHAQEEPERVYAVALAFGAETIATAAARTSLRKPGVLIPQLQEFADISGHGLFALFEYQRKCTAAMAHLTTERTWVVVPPGAVGLCNAGCSPRGYYLGANSTIDVRSWFWEYVTAVAEKVASSPCRDAVMDFELISKAATKAMQCPSCRGVTPLTVLNQFSKTIAAEVDRRLSEISLDLGP